MKKHNFYAGPAILPPEVLQKTADAILDFDGIGLSVASISHRSVEFQAVMDEAQALFKELLQIPEGYQVLLLGGGASLQFCMAPYNLLKTKAVYLNTGAWAAKAIKEAKLFGEVIEVKADNYYELPRNFDVPADADYLHLTSNNTIFGTEYHQDLDVPVPIVADMSSDIFSRPIDVSKYAIIYGGAQKNLAPSGLGFIIVREDALGKVDRQIPTILNYKTHIDKGSMFHTPPVVPIFAALQTLRWIKGLGGLEAVQKMNHEKAKMLYAEIERNKLFRATINKQEDRSVMNVCWVMAEAYKELEKDFLAYATNNGMIGVKGHRSVGGFRASIYNALPKESVEALIALMKKYEAEH